MPTCPSLKRPSQFVETGAVQGSRRAVLMIAARCQPGRGAGAGPQFQFRRGGRQAPSAGAAAWGAMFGPWGAAFECTPGEASVKHPFSLNFQQCLEEQRGLYGMIGELMRDVPMSMQQQFGGRGREWDVEEEEKAWLLRFELPGYGAKDVTVQVQENNVLTISAKQSPQSETRSEEQRFRSRGAREGFATRLTLPSSVQTDAVSAKLSNGILVVTLPKVVKQPPSVINVAVDEAAAVEDENMPVAAEGDEKTEGDAGPAYA